jgi:hypothetical protein
MRSAVHELGAKASFDVLSWKQEPGASGPFSLRPFAGLYGEVSDQRGTEDAYLEAGLEPSWRLEIAGRKVGLGLPFVWGLSADDYYLDDRGGNETLGYFSAGIVTSVALPVRAGCGEWFLNASLQYLHLFADNVVALNSGDRDAWIGKVGIGFVF